MLGYILASYACSSHLILQQRQYQPLKGCMAVTLSQLLLNELHQVPAKHKHTAYALQYVMWECWQSMVHDVKVWVAQKL
jgi:hypothetical protein